MRAALSLAARGLGRVWPNPAVGCVLVGADGAIVGRGWTQPGGRPHAETEALRRAGDAARGATAYVSLEPCAHTGKTPPCAEALIAAGIGRVVVPMEDPDPRVAGRGIARLRAAGIRVDLGACAAAAAELNAGFFLRVSQERPLVSLKLATSLDGRIATRTGDSRWITGDAARRRAHLLRATHDAILIGSGTALADDPELTCRLPGLADQSPVRVVLDRGLRLPESAKLLATAGAVPSWIIAAATGDAARKAALEGRGAQVIEVPAVGDRLSLTDTLQALGERGITRLLVEGGSALTASLLQQDLVDRVYWFRSGAVIGGDGLAAVGGLAVERLTDARRFARVEMETIGADVLETYRRE
ncbi:MAG: bifunctional diaminohydroxyphosphoribosylaminopyrimidine deaminase/5-amino-6-(5-phosphoribosylamino)uracil reductase RibD [Dongiaceae bacterium]